MNCFSEINKVNVGEDCIILYHGTNISFKKINLNYCSADTDFSRGFYLTSSLSQASKWAKEMEFTKGGKATVLCFKFNKRLFEQWVNEGYIKFKDFNEPNPEWGNFLLNCRRNYKMFVSNSNVYHDFDIVQGPLGDSQLKKHIRLISSFEETIEEFCKAVSNNDLEHQISFHTVKSLELLEYQKEEVL